MAFVKVQQGRLFREVESKDFKAGGQATFDLPLGYDLDSVMLELSGTITVGTAPTSYHAHAVPRLIQRLDLFSNGKNKYGETTGLMALLGNFERGCTRALNDITTGTGAKTVRSVFRLDRVTADGVRPKDSSLHAFKPYMSKLQLRVQFGAMVDMVNVAGSFAVSSNDLTVTCYTEETMEFNQADQFEQRLVKQESLIEETIDATKSAYRVKLATGELMTRGVKIYALDDSGVLTNAIINNVQIKSGVDVRMNISGDRLRDANADNYGLQSTQEDGFYFADLCPSGKLNELYDTRGKSELDLVLDVTKPAGGDGTLVIVPVQYYEQAALNPQG